ncbi:hypothetical protein H6F74_19370 [Trichocoleus sp. FACHB-90]|uniref:hypothetical protein n=1 Tax=Cyanophyceae TaxID=3028117 RepID=UPI0016868275|nr:hypothetical protein [Trichocoleus sp. FACHB-90]MBD1928391.1 hypothetical protein [Trichocoleus sp. FACHB-90]
MKIFFLLIRTPSPVSPVLCTQDYSNSRVECDTSVGTWQCDVPINVDRILEPRYIPSN